MKGNKMKINPNEPVFREKVKNALKNQEVTIDFTKSDGSSRKLRCTLLESAIPISKQPKNHLEFENSEVQRVFDIDAGDWRSFKWSSVNQVAL